MSKKSTKRKKQNPPKKKSYIKQIVAAIISVAVIAVCVVVIIFAKSCYDSTTSAKLADSSWVPSNAHNSSGDEVELAEVYNSDHTSYQGSLSFADDSTFSLWLTPGDPTDGTHSGTYSVVDDETIDALFDDGTETQFSVEKSGDEITSISLNYEDYEIKFVQNEG